MARALLASGAGKGTRIALLAPDGALFLTTFYAALRIGALVTPISTLTTPPELAHILRTSDAQILVGARRFLRRDFAAEPRGGAARSGRRPAAAPLRLSSAPHLRSVWLDDARRPRVGTTGRRAPGARRRAATRPTTSCSPPSSGRCRPATTRSSSTPRAARRTPKAVVHGQWAVATKPQALAPIFLMTSEDRTMPLLPAFWLGGIAAALQVLCTGSTLVYPPSPDIDDVLDMIERHDVTYVVVWHALAKLRAAAHRAGHRRRPDPRPGTASRDEHGELIPGPLRANLLGMSESFSAHSARADRPAHARRQGGRVGPSRERHRTSGRRPRDRRGGAAGRGR